MAVFRADRIPYIRVKDGGLPYNIDPQVLFLGYNELSDGEKITLLAMICFDHGKEVINKEGEKELVRKGYCDVSVETLASYRSCSTKTIRAHLNSLEAHGLIIRESTSGDNNSSTRKYFDFRPLLEAQVKVDKISEGLNIKKRLTAEKNFPPEEQKCEPNNTSIKNNISSEYIATTSPSVKSVKEQLEETGIPSYQGQQEKKIIPEGPIREDLNNDPESCFLSGVTGSEVQEPTKPKVSNKIKGIHKKIAGGAYDKIAPKDLIEYFKEKYILKYHRSFSVPVSDLPKTLGLIKRSFLDKHGPKRCIELIDLLFQYHDEAGLATADYPRPSLNNLTQDWLINKILDCAYNKEKAEQLREQRVREESAQTEFGPEEPICISPRDLPQDVKHILSENNLLSQFCLACKRGYISEELLTLTISNASSAVLRLKEVLSNVMSI